MKKEIVRIKCPARYFDLVGFEIDPFDEDRDFVNEVLQEIQSHGAVTAAPSGRRRTFEELKNTRYLGVLSEKLLIDHLQAKLGTSASVSNKAFVDYASHVDVEIQKGGMTMNLEVRSSFAYTSLRNVICRAFDAIGPYTTSYKPGESPNDFYLRGLINENVAKFNPERKHIFYFAGGAPYHWFKEKGRPKDFDQQGAMYLAFKLVNAMDAFEVIDAIRSTLDGV